MSTPTPTKLSNKHLSLPLIGGPITGAILGYACFAIAGLPFAAAFTAGLTAWCAIWWVFEPVPIPITSLLPLALFPLAGILEPKEVGQAYGHPLILLLMGGFMLSQAMARSGAHRRLALNMVNLFGADSPRRIVFGFMAAAAMLSMWISNTATTLMLLPVAMAIIAQGVSRSFTIALLLGIAYAASIGGIGTPIGTPPNLIFMQVYGETTGSTPSFTQWMSWTLPAVILVIPLAGWWLTRSVSSDRKLELPPVGSWSTAEKRVMVVFVLTAIAWITRREPFGGWSAWLDLPQANDASVALLAVVAMAVIPDGRGSRLLDWESASDIPWSVLILFGGGIAIASAFVASGLSQAMGQALAPISQWPVLLMLLVICIAVTFLTEVTSNTATTNLLMPVLAAAGVAAGIDPALLMVPAAMSASCAFMLPVATAPNAIVYGSGQVTIADMMRNGFAINLMGAAVIALVMYWRLT